MDNDGHRRTTLRTGVRVFLSYWTALDRPGRRDGSHQFQHQAVPVGGSCHRRVRNNCA